MRRRGLEFVTGHVCARPQACHPPAFHRRRGTILVAVLVVVTISALAGTTAMYYGEAAASGAQVSLKRTRSRAMAWSGVQAVMSELAVQRERLLDGEAPLVTTQWQMFEQGGRRGIVRLVALEVDEAGLERWAISENAKLDLNLATAEMLAKLGPLSLEQSAAVVSARDKGFGSVEELVRVTGLGGMIGAEQGTEGTNGADGLVGGEESLISLVTVLSFDPNIQAGIDPGGADARGKLRVNLNTKWSEDLANAIRQRFGADAVTSAKALFDAGESFKSMADLVGVLKRTGLPVAAWPSILDALTVSPDPFIPGRVDINRASARVLGAIPGISVDAADEIVRRRQGLSSEVRRSIAWPLSEGILKDEEFIKAVEWFTARSMQWRVRVEVGMMELEAEGEGTGPGREASALEDRMVVEAVVDVASERPRVAYLRDVTLLNAAEVMGASLTRRAELVVEGPKEPETIVPEAVDATHGISGEGLDMDASLKLNATLDFGSDPAPAVSSGPKPAAEPSPRPEAADPVDRRIGRWTSRAGLAVGSAPGPAEVKP